MRKLLASLSLAFALAGTVSDPVLADAGALARKLQDGSANAPVMVVAHRGCWSNAPENSIAAIENCIRLGADMVEIDVRNTADGALVLMHDTTIDRTTNGSGKVSDISFDALRALKLRQGAGGAKAALTEAQVPTLEEALLAARGRILVNLDLKVENEAEVFALVEKLGMNGQILMKLYDTPSDARLINAPFHGKTHYMPIVGVCKPRPHCTPQLRAPLIDYARFNPVAYEVSFFGDREFLKQAINSPRAPDTRIWVNSLGKDDERALTDPETAWGGLVDMGVSMIQTDRPEELLAYLRTRK